MRRLTRISAALAVVLLLTGQARAAFDFNYSTSTSPPSGAIGPNSSLVFADFTNTGPEDPTSTPLGVGISIVQISINSTATSEEGPTTISFTDTITILPTAGGSGLLVVKGSITASAEGPPNEGQASTFAFTALGSKTSVVIGGVTYAYDPASLGYSQPTINVPNSGGLSLNVTASAVPEPASLALVGVGGLLLAAPRLRRVVRRISKV